MRIADRYSVPAESRFELALKNLLGRRFVQIGPPAGASRDGAGVEGGAELTSARTRSAADLSMLLNNTEPLLSQLDVPRLNRVMATLASAVTGREAVLAQGIDDAQTLLGDLTTRRDAIRSGERRVGQECVSTCRSRWSRYN